MEKLLGGGKGWNLITLLISLHGPKSQPKQCIVHIMLRLVFNFHWYML